MSGPSSDITSDAFIDALKRLKDQRFGWLLPDGTLVAVPHHEHFSVLRITPAFAGLVERMVELKEIEADDHQRFIEMYEGDDHIPWHCYGSDAGDAAGVLRTHILATAYEAGWVRVGHYPRRMAELNKFRLHGDRKASGTMIVEFEGTTAGLAHHAALAERIASAFDMAYALHETDAISHAEIEREAAIETALRYGLAERRTSGEAGLVAWKAVDEATYAAHLGSKRRDGQRLVIVTTTAWGDDLPASPMEAFVK